MKKITLIVVDDHKMIREMWANLFHNHPEIELIGSSESLTGGIALIKDLKPDIVLLDINLGDASGLEGIPAIIQSVPGVKIIGVSMHSQPAVSKKMLSLGASGYLTKNSPQEEVFTAIKKVLKGGIYVCEEIKDILVTQHAGTEATQAGLNSLSVREMDVINLIKEGLSSKKIGEKLYLSTKTIETHRYNILKKLNLTNTAALINYIKTKDPSL